MPAAENNKPKKRVITPARKEQNRAAQRAWSRIPLPSLETQTDGLVQDKDKESRRRLLLKATISQFPLRRSPPALLLLLWRTLILGRISSWLRAKMSCMPQSRGMIMTAPFQSYTSVPRTKGPHRRIAVLSRRETSILVPARTLSSMRIHRVP